MWCAAGVECCALATLGSWLLRAVQVSDLSCHLGNQCDLPSRSIGTSKHVLTALECDRSYYPLYPPASGSLLDCSQASNLQLLVTPDILLLPSDLNPFAKLVPVPAPPPQGADADAHPLGAVQTVGQVVCVNPGRLTKGAGGGTFASFRIAPSAEGRAAALGRAPETNGSLAHGVHTRCKATITRV